MWVCFIADICYIIGESAVEDIDLNVPGETEEQREASWPTCQLRLERNGGICWSWTLSMMDDSLSLCENRKTIKHEFQFAINDLKQREEDGEILKKELQTKDTQIESLDERLVSVFILEHKIRALGCKNAKDIEKTIFEYNEKLIEMDKSSRDALRKERQENESKVVDFRNKINLLTQENRKLQFENKSRIQQLNDIILEKDQYLQTKVQAL